MGSEIVEQEGPTTEPEDCQYDCEGTADEMYISDDLWMCRVCGRPQ